VVLFLKNIGKNYKGGIYPIFEGEGHRLWCEIFVGAMVMLPLQGDNLIGVFIFPRRCRWAGLC